ncbi:MAG: hypothetical protein HZB56_23070 [Deltaproteobacteria bacterium]|nr:hypothetical protein [Deltaproteobacteria bacterium]
MRPKTRKPQRLGELIAAAFDTASRHTSNPREVTRLATWVIEQMLSGASGNDRIRLSHQR